jgi:putative hemolysin
MVPRRKIAALDIKTPLHEVIGIVAQSPFSRLPVYRDSLDNIVGILHTKELVRWFVSEGSMSTLADLIRTVPTVHESVTADRILRELRERRTHQTLVVDEFGGTSGLLTLEDVLAELLGHVGDEFKAAHPAAERLPNGRLRLPGGMTVDDAATALELDAKWDTDAATVGGMVIEALGHLPTPGECVDIGAFEFEIERVGDRVIESVIVRAPAAAEPGE